MTTTSLDPGTDTVDATVVHNVHGLVKIQLTSAPRAIRQQLRRRLGPSRGETGDDPDVSIRFVDALPTRGRLRPLGRGDAAYDDDHFYLRDAAGHRTRIDFATLGEPCEIVCESGVTSLPLLVPIVSMRLLRKGSVLLHSAAFEYRGAGTLVAGWQKGGKTEMLLAFMAEGATFVSNEWTIVRGDGSGLLGFGGVVQLWDWHLRSLPRYRDRIPRRDRRRLAMVRLYRGASSSILDRRTPSGALGTAMRQLGLEGGVSLLGQARVSPEDLFGDAIRRDGIALDHVWLASVGGDDVTVAGVDGETIARRMLASQAYERRDLLEAYAMSRFAFPDRASEVLETASEVEARLLTQAFAGKPAHEIVHPYPVQLPDLFRAAAPFSA